MPQPLGNSTEFHEQGTSAPESRSEISDMPPSAQKPNLKSYQKEKTVEPCSPTEDSGHDDIIFSGKVEIISKEHFVSNITQTIPRLEKIQNDSKIPDYVCQKIAEEIRVLKMDLNYAGKGLGKRPYIHATKKPNKKRHTFEASKFSRDQGDEMINFDVDHIDNEPPHTKSSPILNEAIHDGNPLTSPQNIQAFQDRETIKHDTMGQYMTYIMPEPEPKVSSSPNVQGIFLS
ncbi:hypothetical protein O181_006008 [Austropuccinia psidii MF-1]|uniref:Uncharacterized protein n=1 Tax=Austropuccinia psidii MF-1 TaxID=1389203 RepID=A0A9Q3BJD2_9BASI|nr:hypothetical protein [Austropuccinia psidii MF-1]